MKLLALTAAAVISALEVSPWVWGSLLLMILGIYFLLGRSGRCHLGSCLRLFGPVCLVLGSFYPITNLLSAEEIAWNTPFRVGLQLLFMILLANLVSITTPMTALIQAMNTLLCWLRVPQERRGHLSLMTGLIFRMVGLGRESLEKSKDAFLARRASPTAGRIIPTLIRRTLRAGTQMSLSLQSRDIQRSKFISR
jgi:biotin transport system permease protein